MLFKQAAKLTDDTTAQSAVSSAGSAVCTASQIIDSSRVGRDKTHVLSSTNTTQQQQVGPYCPIPKYQNIVKPN